MEILGLMPRYVFWHYTRALSDYKRVFGNLLWFVWNFFSIEILLKTLLTPWRRLGKDESSKHPTFFSNLIINLLMRLVGFLVRSATIAVGLIFFTFIAFLLIAGFFLWFILPFLTIIIFLYSISFFIV